MLALHRSLRCICDQMLLLVSAISSVSIKKNTPSHERQKGISMKANILFLLVAFLCVDAHAQFGVRVGLCGGVPVGDMKTYYGGGVGADVQLKYFLTPNLAVGVGSGFQHFFAKDWGDDYSDVNYNVVPVRFSVTYYLSLGPVKPYVGAEVGPTMTDLQYTYKYFMYSYYYGGFNETEQSDYSHTRFGGAVVLGLESSLGGIFAIDVNVKYNSVSNVSDSAPEQNTSYLFTNIGLAVKF